MKKEREGADTFTSIARAPAAASNFGRNRTKSASELNFLIVI